MGKKKNKNQERKKKISLVFDENKRKYVIQLQHIQHNLKIHLFRMPTYCVLLISQRVSVRFSQA